MLSESMIPVPIDLVQIPLSGPGLQLGGGGVAPQGVEDALFSKPRVVYVFEGWGTPPPQL